MDVDLDGAIVVRTSKLSIYRLSSKEKDGARNVSRDGKELEFDRGRLKHLIKGDRMEIIVLDGKAGVTTLRTSSVVSIKQDSPN